MNINLSIQYSAILCTGSTFRYIDLGFMYFPWIDQCTL